MRSLKSGLFAIALASLSATAAVFGCTASGGDVTLDEEDAAPADPNGGGTTSGAVVPPREDSSAPEDAGKDSSKKDSGPKAEASVDAGPPPPVPGDPCTALNTIGKKNCGACGKAETVCLAVGDSGSGVWSAYGACAGELVGGCIPGAVVEEDCGNCGKVTKTCSQYCAYSSSTCTGQPTNSCVPNSVEWTGAGCDAGTYRNHVCDVGCTWGSYSASCTEPTNSNKMTISGTVGTVVKKQWTLSAAQVGKKVTGTCGGSSGGSVSSLATYPYVSVEVNNPTAQTATIQVYHTGVSGSQFDTLLWAYKSTLPPTDATLAQCDFGSADSCITGNPCGNVTTDGGSTYDFAGIDNVTIPPNGKILVFSGSYNETEIGDFNLNLKTTKLQ